MEITAWLLNVKASAWEDNQVKWMLQVYYLAQEPTQQYGSAGRETAPSWEEQIPIPETNSFA